MNAEKKRKLITIVFDPDLRAVLNDFVNNDEYGLESARDGLDAFHKLAKKYFDIVITDVQMPGLGGVDLLPRLKRIQPWARVIVIPTKKLKSKERQIVETAADFCLERPFQLSQLKAVVQRLCPATEDKDASAEQALKQRPLSWQPG